MKIKHLISFILFSLLTLACTFQSQAGRRTSPVKVKNLERYDIKPYHFGFVLGLNQMTFVPHRTEDYRNIDTLYVVQQRPDFGFHLGIVSNLRVSDYLDLRFIPSLYFGERQLQYTYEHPIFGMMNEAKKIESNILSFPLLLKYKSERMTNSRVYVLAGAVFNLDLASQSKNKEFFDEEHQIKLKRDDFAFEVGVGFDFYLTYFKLATELKMNFGLKDILKKEDDIYTSTIESLNSKIMAISFTFE